MSTTARIARLERFLGEAALCCCQLAIAVDCQWYGDEARDAEPAPTCTQCGLQRRTFTVLCREDFYGNAAHDLARARGDR